MSTIKIFQEPHLMTQSSHTIDINTRNESLSKRTMAGIMAGTLAGCTVAPFVTIIDKSIVQNASGAATMKQSIRASFKDLITRPHRFVRQYEFCLIFGLYSMTYISANMIDTYHERLTNKTNLNMPKDLSKFIGISAVNMSLCLYKDRCFARHFGVIKPSSVPLRTLSLWAMRDLMTIVASFNVPVFGSKYLHENHNEYFPSELKAFTFCQLVSPVFIQIFSTPFHLLGLDMYNNKNSSITNRMIFLRREYLKSLTARMCRIFPAFSIGGLGNKFYNEFLIERMIQN